MRVSRFARFLPLSQRETADEADVSSDRRAAVADVVDRAADLIGAAPATAAERMELFLTDAGLRGEAGSPLAEDPVAALRTVAVAVRSGRRRSIRTLAATVRALLVLARENGVDAGLDPFLAGAAALYASGSAPADRRAVVRGFTVRATDADWSFGHGPVLEGTASGIAAFLLGVSDDPPRRPVSGRE